MNAFKTKAVVIVATIFAGLVAGLVLSPALGQPVCRLSRPDRDAAIRRYALPSAELNF